MSDLVRVDGSLTEEQVDLVKRTIAKDASDQELALFLYQCKRTGLDPLAKQIYLVKRWDNKQRREVMAIQTGIDGYRLMADRTGKYAGNDDPSFGSEQEWKEGGKAFLVPTSATVTVYKIVGGERCPFTATARWTEYYPGEKQGFMWRTKPHLMLGKCAEALALRKAFPAELSGIYTTEEMEQAGNVIEAQVVEPQKGGEVKGEAPAPNTPKDIGESAEPVSSQGSSKAASGRAEPSSPKLAESESTAPASTSNAETPVEEPSGGQGAGDPWERIETAAKGGLSRSQVVAAARIAASLEKLPFPSSPTWDDVAGLTEAAHARMVEDLHLDKKQSELDV